jgi:poly(beta-D-mannuronate) lyase
MNLKQKLLTSSAIAFSTFALLGCEIVEDVIKQPLMLPADKFDLTDWRIDIPTDSNNDGKVDNVSVKKLQTYHHPDYFYLDTENNLVFASPNKAMTTPNSSNTRSELRQILTNEINKTRTYSKDFSLESNKRVNEFAQIGGNLQATLKVNHVAKRAIHSKRSTFSVVVGQIHAGKDQALVAEGEGYGWGNEPLKIYYKKWPNHEYGSVFWNYERNLEKKNPNRKDINYPVWGNSWTNADDPGKQGIALDETFSYEVNVYENIMYLTFTNTRHGTANYKINLANNVDAFGKVDELDHPHGYAGDAHFFKAGVYNQCTYPNCLGTGDWVTDKANGDYVQATFTHLSTGVAKKPKN